VLEGADGGGLSEIRVLWDDLDGPETYYPVRQVLQNLRVEHVFVVKNQVYSSRRPSEQRQFSIEGFWVS
jgi:hypothetical protein